ncbi:MAG: hypothetical protein M3O50_20985 [Myxococcota bacterium]|nr:hypothetical protein [Myxococcota bacterium]
MSSDSNGRKPDAQDPAPPSGASRRQSARAASAWGAARDSLAAVHNLEALLRSVSVPYKTIVELLPELRSSGNVLRDVFERSQASDPATTAVREYGRDRTGELEKLLDATARSDEEREQLANRARSLADELEASAELLALLERAADPLPTEVSVDLIVRETSRMSGTSRGHEVPVRFDEAAPDCVVIADPYVVGPLLSLAIASLRASGVESIAVRARSATFVVEAATETDAALPILAMRVMPTVPPSEEAARRVAEQIEATVSISGLRWSIELANTAS